MSIFMFDAPESESNPLTVALAWSIWLYPIPILIGSIGYWINRKESSLSVSRNYTLISLIGPAAILFILALLVFVCQGQFSCK